MASDPARGSANGRFTRCASAPPAAQWPYYIATAPVARRHTDGTSGAEGPEIA